MRPGDSEITVEKLHEIIELILHLEPPEEPGLTVREIMEEVVRLQLRVADLLKFTESKGEGG